MDRAVAAVQEALDRFGAPVYVRKQIVHNRYVIRALGNKGAVFVEETREVPEGSIVVFSAHGVAPSVHDEAVAGKLATIDATCPLVAKVHKEARRFAEAGYDILLMGHQGHEEVIGTMGQAPPTHGRFTPMPLRPQVTSYSAKFTSPLFRIGHEVAVSWKFISHDRWTTVIPATLFSVAALVTNSVPSGRIIPAAAVSLLYFWLYIYFFSLTNQLSGIEEDRINKPFRPLITGYSSHEAAKVRCVAVFGAFSVLGWMLGVFEWSTLWVIACLIHNCTGLAKNWFCKNLLMGVGVLSQLAAAWEIFSPMRPDAWRWIYTLSFAIFLLIPIQDLRDIGGDVAVGRKTFPIVFGEKVTRRYLASLFLLLPAVVHIALTAPSDFLGKYAVELLLAVMSTLIAFRLIFFQSARSDHKTYRLFEQWYSVVLASSIFML
jgi:4-hydroxybenzoate polyprenyltransferase